LRIEWLKCDILTSFEKKAKDEEECLYDVLAGEFGGTPSAFHELDGCFNDSESFFPGQVFHFYEKGIPIARNVLKVHDGEDGNPISLESTGAILDGKASQGSGERIRPPAEEESPEGPVLNFSSRDIPRAYYHICVLNFFIEGWQMEGIMREVRIHSKNDLKSVLDCPLKAIFVGSGKTSLFSTNQKVKRREIPLKGLHCFRGAIRRLVVHYQHFRVG